MCKQASPVNNNGLKILSFNVEGLASELDDPSFVDLIYQHDICLLNETWKSDESKIGLPGIWDFSLIRPKLRKAGRHSGGLTVFCKEGIRKGVKVSHHSEGFIWIKLDQQFFKLDNPLFICASYIPPEHTSKSINLKTNYFQDLTDSLLRYSNQGNIIIAGDLNARTGNNEIDQTIDIPCIDDICPPSGQFALGQRLSCDLTTNRYGKKLDNICRENNLVIANGRIPGDRMGSYTCYTSRGSSVVDYVISDQDFFKRLKYLQILDPIFGSVHTPLSLTIDCSCNKITPIKKSPIPPPPRFIWDPLKTDDFVTLLSQKSDIFNSMKHKLCNPNCSKDETDTLIKDFTNILYDCSNQCFKLAKRSNPRKKPKTKSWYNSSCLSMKKRLLNLARLLKKNAGDPYIRGKFVTCKREYRTMLRENKKLFEIKNIDQLHSLTHKPKEFWKNLKNTLGKAKSNNANNIASDIWVDHFSGINKSDPELSPQNESRCNEINANIETSLNTMDDSNCPIMDIEFSIADIVKGIKRLKKGKSSALDAISNDILHSSIKVAPPLITAAFNNLLKLQHFPIQWATGVIVPIHKKGELDDPNNFRGITLNSCLSKLFTMLLNDRLTTFCDNMGLINYNQIGFRKGFRTSDHVFTLKTLIDQSFKRKEKLYACFVDFRKAYDTVWRKGLFHKLLVAGISRKFVRLIQDMYCRLQSCVSLTNGLSPPFQSLVGLKQGCNLSPLLFNLFINDIPNMIDNSNSDPPYLGELSISCLLYADDLVILSRTKEGLQESIDTLHKFTDKWFLEINKSKTKCLVFSKGRKSGENFKFNGVLLEMCDSYCYLGVIFTRGGSFNTASKALNDKAAGAMFSLVRNLYKHRTADIYIMLDLFDKMILPIAQYGCEVWGTNYIPCNPNNNNLFDQSNLSKHITESLHYRYLKQLLGVPRKTSNWAVTTETGRYPIILRTIKTMIKYLCHLSKSKSPFLQAAFATSKVLAENGVNSWYNSITRVLKFCGLDYLLVDNDLVEIEKQVNCLDIDLKDKFRNKWLEERDTYTVDSKLDVYVSLKDNHEMAKHLTCKINPSYKIAITKVRLSAHKLPIETDRYLGIPREDRICPLGCPEIGNEYHYLFHCSHPSIARIYSPLMDKLKTLLPEINNMDLNETGRTVLKCKDHTLFHHIGKLCHKVLAVFKEITW